MRTELGGNDPVVAEFVLLRSHQDLGLLLPALAEPELVEDGDEVLVGLPLHLRQLNVHLQKHIGNQSINHSIFIPELKPSVLS